MNLPSIIDIKVSLFEGLEWAVSALKKHTPERTAILYNGDDSLIDPPADCRYLWVYVSTIGELNALSRLLDVLTNQYPASGLVILTDHPHYLDAFKSQYPDASVVSHGENGDGIETLFATFPPLLLLITEIPLLLFDAPCRLSFKVLYYCAQHGGRVFVVNGWLYGEQPSCTMDRLEHRLFSAHYTQLVDAYMLQQSADRARLVAAGATAEKLHVTGNLKFDNFLSRQGCGLDKAELISGERTVLVCGCVTNISEQQLILATCQRLRDRFPDLLCVLAPRHPENSERMQQLQAMLTNAGLTFALRTQQQQPLAADIDVLVLDTFGELQHFYQLADFCYVGLNHNLLEPLAFAKPTYVTPGWDTRYPSFPLYQTLREKALITEAPAATSESLAETIIATQQSTATDDEAFVRARIQALSGTLEQNLGIIQAVMATTPASTPCCAHS